MLYTIYHEFVINVIFCDVILFARNSVVINVIFCKYLYLAVNYVLLIIRTS